MSTPTLRKAVWTAALSKRLQRRMFQRAGVATPAFFICANSEDNARGVIVDVISGKAASHIGPVGFSTDPNPRLYGIPSVRSRVPTIQLPTGAGLSFDVGAIVPSSTTGIVVTGAIRLNRLDRLPASYTDPEYVFRSVISRALLNLGEAYTNVQGWNIGLCDVRPPGINSATYNTVASVRRALSSTEIRESMCASPYSHFSGIYNGSLSRTLDTSALLSFSITLQFDGAGSTVYMRSDTARGYTGRDWGSSGPILIEQADRPLLVGCTRDSASDSYYTEFLDGELLYLGVWTSRKGATFNGYYPDRGEFTNSLRNPIYDPLELFSRLAPYVDESGGTRMFYEKSTFYVSNTEVGNYYDMASGVKPLKKGQVVFLPGGRLAEVLRDYPDTADSSSVGVPSEVLGDGVGAISGGGYSKVTYRLIPTGTEGTPASRGSAVRLLPGDTLIYKSTHAMPQTEGIVGSPTATPVTVILSDGVTAHSSGSVVRVSGCVHLVGGGRINGSAIGVQLVGGRLTVSNFCPTTQICTIAGYGSLDIFDSVLRPSYSWSDSSTNALSRSVPPVGDLGGPGAIMGSSSYMSFRMYGGMTYGSAGLLSRGLGGSSVSMYGVRSVESAMSGASMDMGSGFSKAVMGASQHTVSSRSKVRRVGGIAGVPYVPTAGNSASFPPLDDFFDGLRAKLAVRSLFPEDQGRHTVNYTEYRLASTARRGGARYSLMLNVNGTSLREAEPPVRIGLHNDAAGRTKVRVYIRYVNGSVDAMVFRAIYVHSVTGARVQVTHPGSSWVLNSVSNSLWAAAASNYYYVDIPCPNLGIGPLTFEAHTVSEIVTWDWLYIDPSIEVLA